MREGLTVVEQEFLASLFPFYFSLDRDLTIQQVGPSLRKMSSEFRPGATLSHLVRIRHPICSLELAEFLLRTEKLFLLDLQLQSSAATLRGQWLKGPQDDAYFLGSLWTDSIANLVELGLSLNDFAPIDMTIENIMLHEVQATQAKDHQDLMARLEAAVDRENHRQALEKSLARELDLYADLLLRFDSSGAVEEGLATELCPISMEDLTATGNVFEHRTLGFALQDAVDWLKRFPDEPQAVDFEIERHGREFHFEGRIARTQEHSFLFLARDVTERKEIAKHLENLAHHDSLTQLPNRAYFESRLRDAFLVGLPFALFLIDVNDFKVVNDSYGHLTGDQVLRGIASRIHEACSDDEVAARWGGDEFAVLAERLPDPETAQAIAERIVEHIMQPLEIEEDAVIHPKVSVGVVIPRGNESFSDLLRNVDIAMYRSKGFRNDSRITRFEDEMLDHFMDRLVLKQDFGKALRRKELRVFYQPIFDFRKNEFTKCEALVRWQHPERGLLTPFHFVDLAEEAGLISEMGLQVLAQSCKDAKFWDDAEIPMNISVNVSATQLHEPGFFDTILRTMEQSGIAAEQLTIEITESVLVTNADDASTLLTQLKDAGIRVAIDDFGVGYSSLQYLAKLPVDIVKIDKTFVQELDESSGAGYRLFEAMVNLGRTLQLEIVAEGIETKEHERQVRAFGCDFGQGYLYSRPVPLDEAFRLTASGLAWQTEEDNPEVTKAPIAPNDTPQDAGTAFESR